MMIDTDLKHAAIQRLRQMHVELIVQTALIGEMAVRFMLKTIDQPGNCQMQLLILLTPIKQRIGHLQQHKQQREEVLLVMIRRLQNASLPVMDNIRRHLVFNGRLCPGAL